ncbi:ABC transporter permease (plasmid) [Agrobacterium deltaense]
MTSDVEIQESAVAAAAAVPYRPWRSIGMKFLSYPVSTGSLVLLVLIVLFAFLGEHLWLYSYAVPSKDLSTPPGWAHPFGTDQLGYDLMAMVMRGAQRSLAIAGVVAVLATLIGAVWGATAAYVGGWVDSLMMRFVDLMMIFPVLAIAAFLNRQIRGGANGWLLVAVVLAVLSWPLIARVVRSVVLSLRTREFIIAARIAGAGPVHIIFRHLLPNALGSIIVAVTVLSATAVLSETALSYLGFGVQPPDTSLGLLINSAQSAVSTRPWLFYFPGFFIILIALCMSFIGDGLRAALDPRQQGK